MKVIKLKIDKEYTCIAGYHYGAEIYEEQVKPHFNGTEKIEIHFPDHVEAVAISFVQGFINGMLKLVSDKNRLLELVTLKSNDDYLTNRLYEDLRF